MQRINRPLALLLTLVLLFAQHVGLAYAQYSPQDYECMKLGGITCFYDPSEAPACSTGSEGTIQTSTNNIENLKAAYNYFLSKTGPDGAPVLSKVAAAAIIGNIAHESGGNPLASQNPKGNTDDPLTIPTQEQASLAANSGKAVGVGRAWGLIQWDHGARALYYQKKAGITGDIKELQTQLELVWWHMTNESPTSQKNMIAGFTQTDLIEAVKYYEINMEGAGNKAYDQRYKAAKLALDTFPVTRAGALGGVSSAEPSANNTKPIIVLDPGHTTGGKGTTAEKEPATGLNIGDYSNLDESGKGEDVDVWNVAQEVKKNLGSDYEVVLTKDAVGSYTNLKLRAEVANSKNATLAVSIHTTPGNFGATGPSMVIPQEVGTYREGVVTVDGKTVRKRTTFNNQPIADKSKQYAQAFVAARKAAGENGAAIAQLSFNGDGGKSPGNISIVQLFSNVPWVYHEAGQTNLDIKKYADGITAGIKSAVPISTSAAGNASSTVDCSKVNSGAGAAAIVAKALEYSWPKDDHGNTPNDAYRLARYKAIDEGKTYVGAWGYRENFTDCGGFVTRVMIDSGADPNYNNKKGATGGQLLYALSAKDTWREYDPQKESPEPGDIAIADSATERTLSQGENTLRKVNPSVLGHTFIYVGPQAADTYTKQTASASLGEGLTGNSGKAPRGGTYDVGKDPDYHWFRLIKTTSDTENNTPAVLSADKKQKLQTKINQLATGNTKSITIRTLDGVAVSSSASTTPQTTASVFKLFVAYSVLKRVDDGSRKLTDSINGTTFDTCLSKMIGKSDNDCAYAFGDSIGWQTVTADARALGLSGTTMVGGAVNPERKSTTDDVTTLLVKLQSGSLLSPASTQKLITLMKSQTGDRSGIPAGVAPSQVADKPGWGTASMNNDAGIVYATKGTYTVAIFTQNVGNFSKVSSVAKEINAIMNE